MLLLIWCGALCSFTDPSLWLLHSRSPPRSTSTDDSKYQSTFVCASVCPAVRPCRVTPFPPPPPALCGCQVPSSCPVHPHSSVTSFSPSPAVSFCSSSSISSPFPGHLNGLYTRGGCSMVHFLIDLDLIERPFSAPTKLPIWCPPHVWLLTPSSTHSPGNDGRYQSSVRGGSNIWVTLTGFRWSTLPFSVTCLKPLLCGLLLASDLHLNSRASLFLVSADIILSICLVFACCCTKIGLMEPWGLILMCFLGYYF